jgi:hypothetical protein
MTVASGTASASHPLPHIRLLFVHHLNQVRKGEQDA